MQPIYQCHRCGATSYKPVLKRGLSGALQPTSEQQCAGCGFIFTDLDEWRSGVSGKTQVVDVSKEQS